MLNNPLFCWLLHLMYEFWLHIFATCATFSQLFCLSRNFIFNCNTLFQHREKHWDARRLRGCCLWTCRASSVSLLEICGYEGAGIMNSALSLKVGHFFFFKLIYLCFCLFSIPVKVCNCTELGYCYIPPTERNHVYGMGPTIGILAGVLGLCSKHDKPEAVNIKICNLVLRQCWLPFFLLLLLQLFCSS